MSKRSERLIQGLVILAPLVVLALAGTTLFLWGDFFAEAARRLSPGCFSRKWFHVYCPGCGGTRAFCALAKGDFLSVLKYNCWWIPTAFVLAGEYVDWALEKLFPQRNFPGWKKARRTWLNFYLVFTVAYMVARNIWRF